MSRILLMVAVFVLTPDFFFLLSQLRVVFPMFDPSMIHTPMLERHDSYPACSPSCTPSLEYAPVLYISPSRIAPCSSPLRSFLFRSTLSVPPASFSFLFLSQAHRLRYFGPEHTYLHVHTTVSPICPPLHSFLLNSCPRSPSDVCLRI